MFKPTSFRIPDVCLLRADAPFESILRDPPLLCIEIMSPEDRRGRACRTVWGVSNQITPPQGSLLAL